jgi:peroxiredoxin
MNVSLSRRSIILISALACSVLALGDVWLTLKLVDRQMQFSAGGIPWANRNESADMPEPRAGSSAFDFTLRAMDGREVRLREFRGKQVLLMFMCGCSKCLLLAPELERIHQRGGAPVVIGITSMEPDEARSWCESAGITFLVLTDVDQTVAKRYSSTICPRCWLVDERGAIAYTMPIGATPKAISAALHEEIRRRAGVS